MSNKVTHAFNLYNQEAEASRHLRSRPARATVRFYLKITITTEWRDIVAYTRAEACKFLSPLGHSLVHFSGFRLASAMQKNY